MVEEDFFKRRTWRSRRRFLTVGHERRDDPELVLCNEDTLIG